MIRVNLFTNGAFADFLVYTKSFRIVPKNGLRPECLSRLHSTRCYRSDPISIHIHHTSLSAMRYLSLGSCGTGWTRTSDTRIFSAVLYQLSYRPIASAYLCKGTRGTDYPFLVFCGPSWARTSDLLIMSQLL